MEALFLYFGKVIFTSGVMFLYYKLFLKDKTFHHYNRFYLLAAVLTSLTLPLLQVSYFTLEVNSNMYLLINSLQNLSSTNNSNNDFNYFKIGAFFTGLVAVSFLTKLIFGLVKIQILKKKFSKENFEEISFYQTDLAEAPFSFFKNLFWKNSIELQSDLGRQILKHEMVHIEQKHSWDKIFLEIITSLFWFNPFFYLIKKEINLIHEYLADNKAVKNSDTKAFAQMLLATHFSGKQLPATSPFLSSNLKKRLTMLKKSKTKFSYARRILALPLLFILSFLYLINAKNKEIINTNLEIENVVSQLKSDTIKPKNETKSISQNDVAIGADGTKLDQEHPKLFSENDTIIVDDVSESAEFKKRIAEAEKLAKKAEQKMNSPQLKKRIKEAEKRAAEADRLVNSPEFKKRIEDAEKRATEADRLVNSPEFKKRIANAEKRAAEAEKLVNSPEFKKRIEDAEKSAARSEQKLKYAEFKQNVEGAEIIAIEPSTYKPNSGIKFTDETDIFINGKSATREEMQILNPKKIESVVVTKKDFDGKKRGQIHIKLKK
ncbi:MULTISPECIES: M56 family metallopeptidase [unclassified Kaistella]|uniref:M56 family metallopeptidase n=1 Tax=unclassified Kaistella TaxID=2762626 RepID=UPI002735FB23|nr:MULTISPECIES: M56 family metallopeptidase [unclassified Kaistella]MDP2453945.1 M56 family metallopeptidase [Kaistella sp. SH11-4b]MDP2457002.1 M56 family metallopeptidase [Kaistella sp. SH40-3]MDP2459759.1 M56 family metallopeptidase [Kaistella sp. SH19-2b]